MSWTETGSEGQSGPGVNHPSKSVESDEKISAILQPVDIEQAASDSTENVEGCPPTSWSLDLPFNYGDDLKSFIHVKGMEFEARMNVLVAQFTESRINLPMFLVSSVLLFTVGVFIGRRSSSEIL